MSLAIGVCRSRRDDASTTLRTRATALRRPLQLRRRDPGCETGGLLLLAPRTANARAKGVQLDVDLAGAERQFERRRLAQGLLVHLDDVEAEAGEGSAQRRAEGKPFGHRRVFRRRQ